MKCKVATSVTLTFHDKNIDMHDIRVIHVLAILERLEFRCVNLTLSIWH